MLVFWVQMALGEPPRSGVPSFRLLFLIVREPPPQLEGNFSVEFKDFVWQCLRKAPADRPSAIDLLMHPFVAVAERPPDLPQRIARVTEKKEAQIAAQGAAATQGEDVTAGGSAAQGWDFGTERAAPPPADIHATVQRRRSPSPVRDYSGTFVDRGAPLTQNASPFSGTVQRPPPVDIPASPPSRAAAAMSSASGSSRPLADAAPLKLLLQPALRAAAGGDPKATAAAESAAAALAHLESTTPGATRAAVAQMLSILGSSTSASLSDLRSSAQTSLGGGGKGPALPVELSAEAGAVSSSVDLGPLGNFLLARWQGEVSRETQGPV